MAQKTLSKDAISASAETIANQAARVELSGKTQPFGAHYALNIYDSARERKYPEGTPTVLFIHGARGTLKMWGPFTKTIAQDCRMVAYEFSGHGKSDSRSIQSINDYVAELKALMDKLGIKASETVLVGYSLGGDIAHNFARQYGVKGTVLLGVNPDPTRFGAIKSNVRFINKEMFNKKAEAPIAYDENRFGGIMGMIRAYPTKSFGEQKGKSPCLLFNGEYDEMTTVEEAKKTAARIPNSRLVIVEKTWHQVVYTQKFEDELRNFISSVSEDDIKSARPVKMK